MYCKRALFIVFLFLMSIGVKAQFLEIDDSKTPKQLILDEIINSPCIIVTGERGSGNPVSGENSYASFVSGGSNFPFKKGIVLSTSPSKNARGPFISDNAFGQKDSKWKGDNDLNKALGNGSSTQATVLEFDFVAFTNSLSFNYIFASNEFVGGFPCFYSDGFAFLIKKAGSEEEYKNLAIVPNTNLPVSATNIHPKIYSVDNAGCDAKNEVYFKGYNNYWSPINYGGQTVVMNASTEIVPGETYHLKLVIADDKTGQYNSAIFIESGSFEPKVNLGKDRIMFDNNPVCFGETIVLDTQLDASYSFKWFKDGNLIPGANSNTFTVSVTGNYAVNVKIPNNLCFLDGEVKIEIPEDVLSVNTSLIQCDHNSDGYAVYNLRKVDNIVKRNVTEILNQGYYETKSDAISKTNAILTPEKYTNKTVNQILFARIENKYGCYKIAEVKLLISNETINDIPSITACDVDDNQDGLREFNLSLDVTPKVTDGLPNDLTVDYYFNLEDAFAEKNIIPNIFVNTVPFTQIIFARFVNGPNCYDIKPITLTIHTFNVTDFGNEIKYLCKNSEISLGLSSSFNGYMWSTGSRESSISVNSPGEYALTIKNENGCERTKVFKIILSEPAVITDGVVKDFSGMENSVLIEYTGVGNYEFSLDGNVFQDTPLFMTISPGIYNAIARDKNGCGISNSFSVYVLDYPRFFTPNDDGHNDIWIIKNLNLFGSFKLSIFDRYGKLLKQIDQNEIGWDGKFNGHNLLADDYWFTLVSNEGRKISGHFSLKR